MSAQPVSVTATLEPVSCFHCGTWFGIDSHLRAELLRTHRTFYCPSGHTQHYTGEPEEKVLKRWLESRDAEIASLRDQREHLKNSNRTVRGHLTRVKKRIGNGVCPCCQRTFENVARHMKSEHPSYATPVEGA